MTDNPHVGTEFETSWSQGYLRGFATPDNLVAPSPLAFEQQEAYLQGVVAGGLAGGGLRIPRSPSSDELHDGWHLLAMQLVMPDWRPADW